ncbi:MAG: tryptophan synthase subunit alpha [Legionellaceae bacterium]|nr:tryptophan synthase subunit alpha [Legionellaceae bacterium]
MIQTLFEKGQKVFIPFIMAGHPSLEETKHAVLALSAAGADLIELGVPFSDPVADGPVNQMAAEIALAQGVNLHAIFALVQSLRHSGCDTPIILFSYLNPILALGYETFAKEAKAAGVNGVLVVDLPPEEGEAFYAQLSALGLGVVLLISPTTNPARFAQYHRVDPAFIYYISRCAVTGVQNDLAPQLADEIQTLRSYFPNKKVVVGFGISSVEQAATVAQLADGVVVGSLLVRTLQTEGLEAFTKLAERFVEGIPRYSE